MWLPYKLLSQMVEITFPERKGMFLLGNTKITDLESYSSEITYKWEIRKFIVPQTLSKSIYRFESKCNIFFFVQISYLSRLWGKATINNFPHEKVKLFTQFEHIKNIICVITGQRQKKNYFVCYWIAEPENNNKKSYHSSTLYILMFKMW